MRITGSPLPISSATSETELLQLTGPHESSLRVLERLDPNTEIQRRQKLYTQVHQSLLGLSLTPIYPELLQGTVPCGYPFISDDPTMRKRAAARRKVRC